MGHPSLGALLVLGVLSAGCLDGLIATLNGEDGREIVVPFPAYGETWEQVYRASWSGRGDHREFSSKASVKIEPSAGWSVDRYGRPIEVVFINTTYEQTSDGPQLEDLEIPKIQNSTATLEVEELHWVMTGSMTWVYKASTASPCLGGPSIKDTNVFFATDARRYNATALYGNTLKPGAEFRTPSSWNPAAIIVQTVLAWEEIENSLAPGTKIKALPVETRVIAPLSGAPQDEPSESSNRAYYVEGIPQPLLVVLASKTNTSKSHTELALTAHAKGTTALVARGGPIAAQWTGLHPEAKVSKHGTRIDPDVLGLRFPLKEALEWLRVDPRALQFQLWLVQNPDAYLAEARYERNDAEREYEWQLYYSNGKDLYSIDVERHYTNAGPHAHEIRFSYTLDDWGRKFYAPSAAARSMDVVNADLAFSVAAKFLPSDATWRTIGWGMRMSSFLADGGGEPVFRFGVGAGGEKREYGTLPSSPSFYRYQEWSSPGRSVNGTSGALLNGAGGGSGCGSWHKMLPLPVATGAGIDELGRGMDGEPPGEVESPTF